MTTVEILVAASILLNVLVIILLLTRNLGKHLQDWVGQQITAVEKGQERLEHTFRSELVQGRGELGHSAKLAREEMGASFQGLGDSLTKMLRETAAWQKDRFEGFANEITNSFASHDRRTINAIAEMSNVHKGMLDSFAQQMVGMTQINEKKLEEIRLAVEQKLSSLQAETRLQLDQMRATVDEKLHQTLEKRLGESFKLVSERLEQVHKGLGEMQTLASGVGDLKRVLTNVKTRGTMGEIQLENILEQTLTHDQYARNVAVSPGGSERVDFAVLLPGKEESDYPLWLPVDAKFPLETYQRLLDAQDAGDLALVAETAKLLEGEIRSEAKSIQEKYLDPPHTTEFAIMFLPIEGLFAEVLRRPGLWEALQRDCHVVVTGPTTITALLNSLQMGFRTLAIQKRSGEVWTLLGAVKTEFGKFGDVLEKTQKKLQEASNTIDSATRRSRAIERRLRTVEAVSSAEPPEMLPEVDALVSE